MEKNNIIIGTNFFLPRFTTDTHSATASFTLAATLTSDGSVSPDADVAALATCNELCRDPCHIGAFHTVRVGCLYAAATCEVAVCYVLLNDFHLEVCDLVAINVIYRTRSSCGTQM